MALAHAASVRGAAVLLVAAALALRTWATFSGYFYWDDYLLAGRSARIGLSPELLLYDHDGHFMPGAMVVNWLVTSLAPMSFGLPAAVMVLGQALAAFLFLRLLLEIFGERRLVLVPLGVYVLGPMTLASSVWFSAASNLLPMQIAGSLLGLAVVRNARRPSRRHVVQAVAAYALGLLFFEKSLLLLLVAAGLAYLVADPSVPGALRRAYRQQRRLAPALVGLTLAYLVAYTARMSPRTRLPEDPSVVWETVRRGVADTVAPMLLGGPLTWTPAGWGSAIASPPTWLVWMSLATMAVLIAVTSVRRRAARDAWVMAGGYLCLDLAAFVVTRSAGPAGALVVQSTRYTADAAPVICLALGWALMAPLGSAPGRAPLPDSWPAAHRTAARVVMASAAAAVLAAALVSTVRFTDIWRDNASRPYVTAAETSLHRADPSVPLLDQPVPPFVLYGLASPYHLASWVFAPLADRPPIGSSTSRLLLLDDRGRLVPGVVQGRTARNGPDGGCGWRLSSAEPTVIPLDGPLYEWDWTLRVGYLASRPATGTVRVGFGRTYEVPYRPGLNELFVNANGGGQDVSLRLDDPAGEVCVGDVTVGLAHAAPGR